MLNVLGFRCDGSQRADECRHVALGVQRCHSRHHAAERCNPNYRMGGPGQEEVLLPGCVHDLDHQNHRLPIQPHPHSAPGAEGEGPLLRHL